MNKKELVSLLSERLGLSLRKTAVVLDIVLSTVMEATSKDGRCLCGGGHKFVLRSTKSRKGRNPNTGETLIIPEKHFVTYRKIVPAV